MYCGLGIVLVFVNYALLLGELTYVIYFNIDIDSPPTSVIEMMEVSDSFVGVLDYPVVSNSMELVIEEVPNRRKALNFMTVEIEVTIGSVLIVIPKDKLKSLIKGNSYTIRVS